MKIAILGTRGIPNNYGGFEQFAEYISTGLVKRGHDVTVYNPTFHKYKGDTFQGVKLVKVNSPERLLGGAANFIYDYRCLKHAAKQSFDLLYETGYVSVSPSFYLINNSSFLMLTNMDGLEWKRAKWNFFTKQIMRFCERLTVRKSHYLVADNIGIQSYYQERFGVTPFYLPYGADVVENFDESVLHEYGLEQSGYYILVARMEKENNVEMVLEAFKNSGLKEKFLVVGGYQNKYGKYLYDKFSGTNIHFLNGIYDKGKLDSLRQYSKAYLHGHSVGGTNPSLLEAMASGAFIIAHGNNFNRSVLGKNALYFNSKTDLTALFLALDQYIPNYKGLFINENINLIREKYNWDHVVSLHEEVFNEALSQSRK